MSEEQKSKKKKKKARNIIITSLAVIGAGYLSYKYIPKVNKTVNNLLSKIIKKEEIVTFKPSIKYNKNRVKV